MQDWNSQVVSYTYTIAGQPLETHLPNGVLSQSSYDEAGQLLSLSHTRQGVTLSSFTYAHDLIGNRTVVSETLFTPAAAYLPLVVNSPGEGEGMSAPEGESLSYPGPEYPPPGALLSPFWQGLVEFFTRILTSLTPSAAAHAAQTGVSAPLPELSGAPNLMRLQSSQAGTGVTVITYTYDPLSRLTAADYSDGTYFHYSYDAVGNRLSETTLAGTSTYTYDPANRLSSVNGIPYTWDDNGNLLLDGANTYTYDHANRLVGFNGPSISATYAYNGIGDRLQESVNGQSTSFSMDLNAGLPRAMSDGTHSYLYGTQRIFQEDGSGEEYFLGDALGSVRQLVDGSGMVTLTKGYEPYGEGLGGAGWSSSSYGFTGEWEEYSTELLYLRSRWYGTPLGLFITRDIWSGVPTTPMSLHAWLYTNGNPVNFPDPTGMYPGIEVHKKLTEARVVLWGKLFPINGIVPEQLAKLIAAWDLRVDGISILNSIVVCGPCHFMPLAETTKHVNTAIDAAQPYLFGGALHQMEDYFSHWREGYHDQLLGHGAHTVLAKSWPGQSTLVSDFFHGGHFTGNGVWMKSPYPVHPRESVVAEIRQRNPGIDLTHLSDRDLIDLYLRLDTSVSNWQSLVQKRDYFGFDTDLYVASSTRDVLMKIAVDDLIVRFLQNLALVDCPSEWVNWTYPPNVDMERELKDLLRGP